MQNGRHFGCLQERPVLVEMKRVSDLNRTSSNGKISLIEYDF